MHLSEYCAVIKKAYPQRDQQGPSSNAIIGSKASKAKVLSKFKGRRDDTESSEDDEDGYSTNMLRAELDLTKPSVLRLRGGGDANSDREDSIVSQLVSEVPQRTYAQAVLGTQPVVDSKNESTPEYVGTPAALLETELEETDEDRGKRRVKPRGRYNTSNPVTVPLSTGSRPSREDLRMNNPSTRPGDAVGTGTADLLRNLATIPTAHTPVYYDSMRPRSIGAPDSAISESAPITPTAAHGRKRKNSTSVPPIDRVTRNSRRSTELQPAVATVRIPAPNPVSDVGAEESKDEDSAENIPHIPQPDPIRPLPTPADER